MNVGSKSITAQRQKIRDKRRQRANKKRKDNDLVITLKINFDPLCNALKKAYETIKNFSEQLKENLSKVFPIPAMLNLHLQLQLANNSRPNKYLIGWGRSKMEVIE